MQWRLSATRLMVALIACAAISAPPALAIDAPPPREVDARRAEAAGLRELTGRHVRLFTDLPSSPAVDELPALFDAAIPQWAKYFGLAENSIRGKFLGFLIRDREKFAALGLLPEENRDFANGYNRNYEFWLVDQPSDYYRRHLWLHEGTHAFMQTQLGGAGPGWYMEGVAELLGAHRWHDGQLELGVIPASKEEVPMWGRVKIIRDAVAAGKPWPIDAVLEVDNRRQLDTENYAWTWALTAMLDGTPKFRDRFRGMQKLVADPEFNAKLREVYARDWVHVLAEWESFVSQLDYGYDIERMALATEADRQGPLATKVAADRGWQSSGWPLKAGRLYRVEAKGEYQIANDGEPWPCEPNGVTIEYHDGRPLGTLLGAIWSRDPNTTEPSFAKPVVIGAGATIRPDRDGMLFLRVNDSPAMLDDNAGSVEVRMEPLNNGRPLAPGQ